MLKACAIIAKACHTVLEHACPIHKLAHGYVHGSVKSTIFIGHKLSRCYGKPETKASLFAMVLRIEADFGLVRACSGTGRHHCRLQLASAARKFSVLSHWPI